MFFQMRRAILLQSCGSLISLIDYHETVSTIGIGNFQALL